MKKLLGYIIGGIIGCIIVLLFFYLLGIVMNIMETYPILAVILGIVDIILILKEIEKN